MSSREYIGARYVPVFANQLEWNAANTYEPLTVVLYQGNSFTSMRAVPAGIDISNTSYWAQTGNYNAQIEQYRQEVQSLLPAVPVSKGGTGSTTAADALVALGAAESGGATNTLYDAEQAIAENAADIADLQDSVYTPAVHTLTPEQTGITVNYGGYVKMGNLVIISVCISTSSATSRAAVLSGLPSESSPKNHGLSASDATYVTYGCRIYGERVFCDAIPASTMVVIEGAYFLS